MKKFLVDVEKKEQTLPKEFALYQNYPNPFNPSTIIKYSVPAVETKHTSYLQIIVYDILGREITTLVNKQQKPGDYQIMFDASNLPSGVYLYQLKARSFLSVKKMLLLR